MTPIEPKAPKMYSLSKDELDFLRARQSIINQYAIASSDMDFIMRQYLLTTVAKRLSLAPDVNIKYNLDQGTVEVTEPEPTIILPEGVKNGRNGQTPVASPANKPVSGNEVAAPTGNKPAKPTES